MAFFAETKSATKSKLHSSTFLIHAMEKISIWSVKNFRAEIFTIFLLLSWKFNTSIALKAQQMCPHLVIGVLIKLAELSVVVR